MTQKTKECWQSGPDVAISTQIRGALMHISFLLLLDHSLSSDVVVAI